MMNFVGVFAHCELESGCVKHRDDLLSGWQSVRLSFSDCWTGGVKGCVIGGPVNVTYCDGQNVIGCGGQTGTYCGGQTEIDYDVQNVTDCEFVCVLFDCWTDDDFLTWIDCTYH